MRVLEFDQHAKSMHAIAMLHAASFTTRFKAKRQGHLDMAKLCHIKCNKMQCELLKDLCILRQNISAAAAAAYLLCLALLEYCLARFTLFVGSTAGPICPSGSYCTYASFKGQSLFRKRHSHSLKSITSIRRVESSPGRTVIHKNTVTKNVVSASVMSSAFRGGNSQWRNCPHSHTAPRKSRP